MCSCFTPALQCYCLSPLFLIWTSLAQAFPVHQKVLKPKTRSLIKTKGNEYKYWLSITLVASKSIDAFIFITFLKILHLNCSWDIAEGRSQGRREEERKRKLNLKAGVLSKQCVWLPISPPFRKTPPPTHTHKFPYPSVFSGLKCHH